MKKHAGKFVCAGLLVSVFGLILMAGAFIVTEMILGAGHKSSPELIKGALGTAGEASLTLLIIGALALVIGLFMHTQPE